MIEFIIPTYNRPYQLATIINSIFCQTNTNWKIHVVADAVYDGYDEVKQLFNNKLNKVRFTELDGPHNDWGHTPRLHGLETATAEWVVMTGDDNYYVPTFVEEFLSKINDYVNFIYCDMLHNHYQYGYMVTKPVSCYIDIGAFASRTQLARHIPFNKNSYTADGEFVEQYVSAFCETPRSIVKIEKSLYIHN